LVSTVLIGRMGVSGRVFSEDGTAPLDHVKPEVV
jgi:hypothetical protein